MRGQRRTEQVLIKGEKRKGEAPGKPKIRRIVVDDVPLQRQIEGENGIRCHQALTRQKPYGLLCSGLPEHHGCQNRGVWNPVSYTHLRAHETDSYLVCRLLLEKKKNTPT